MRWHLRMAGVIVGVILLEIQVFMVAPRPFDSAVILPVLIPLLTALLVVIPKQNAEDEALSAELGF
jgi:hypothetical protein